MRNITAKSFSRRRIFTCALLLAALVAIVTLALNPRASADSRANISSDIRTLITYGNELFDHDAGVEQLSKKATLARAEVDSVNTKAGDLKRRLPQIQQAFRSIINKLKTANQLGDFDRIVFARIKDERTKALLREGGGPRRILESIASDIPQLAQELEREVQGLRSKLRAQAEENLLNPNTTDLRARSVRVAFTPAAFFRPIRCRYWQAVFVSVDCSGPTSTVEDCEAQNEAGQKIQKYCK